MKLGITTRKPFIVLTLINCVCLLIFYKRAQNLPCPSSSSGEDLNNGFNQHNKTQTYNTEEKEQQGRAKPIVLLWFWPLGLQFDLGICLDRFHVDGCLLTDDRSLYQEADVVVFYHKNIGEDMPENPRPPFQKWIWFNVESPTNTHFRIIMENLTMDLFNLTLNYRRDADIIVRNELTIRRQGTEKEPFILPKKDKLVCWIVSNNNPMTGTATRASYYEQLMKHIGINGFGKAFTGEMLPDNDYYSTISSCKFYLSFENSIHSDYITEKVNGPLVAGTVPIVMGPPRENYEQFLPSGSFIHVNDFEDPKSLADFLLHLDQSNEEYIRYFRWREFYTATPHLLSTKNEFIHPICLACKHMATDGSYRVKHNLHQWYFSP